MSAPAGRIERAYLGLGGNLGDPRRSMAEALRMLDARGDVSVAQSSSLYRTPPWGKTDQPDFLNAVAALDTSLPARDLLDACLAAERALKRERRERWGPRLIDLDILLHGRAELREEGLQIPHPRMLERAFVLAPLAEIAPALVIGGDTVAEHLSRLDTSGILRLPDGGAWWR